MNVYKFLIKFILIFSLLLKKESKKLYDFVMIFYLNNKINK